MQRIAVIVPFALFALVACNSCDGPSGPDAHRIDTTASDSSAPKPFIFGEVRTLRSAILQQDRTLNVYLPDGYSPDSARTYPVIYVLDGSANEDFPHLAGLAQYMNMYDLLPKSIVVGIANVDRKQDFTFPTRNDSDRAWVSNSGGSARFIRFLADEVQPFVNDHYKTSGKRSIVGQSLGGLLATEILFKRPELFDDYILVSPSVWWDTGSLADSADAWTKAHATEPKRIFVAMASDDDMMQKEVDKVTAAFKANARPPLRWTCEEFPQETHATILHRAVYRAFEWMGKERLRP
jgi:predicted alpha/beta superfamily hydrolase